jgi:acyl carrier protein
MRGLASRVAVPEMERWRRWTMQQDDIQAVFGRVLEEVAKVNRAEVTGDKRLREDLGIDSLSLIDVAVAAEDKFGIRIADDDLENFQTVSDVAGYVRQDRRLKQIVNPGRALDG